MDGDILLTQVYRVDSAEDSASMRTGVVQAVDTARGLIDVEVAGELLREVPYAAGLSPIVGATVWLIAQGSWFAAVSAAASTGQGAVGGGGSTFFAPWPPANPEVGAIWVDASAPHGTNLMGPGNGLNSPHPRAGLGYATPAATWVVNPDDSVTITWAPVRTDGGNGLFNFADSDSPEPRFPQGEPVLFMLKGHHEGEQSIRGTVPFRWSTEWHDGAGEFILTGVGSDDTGMNMWSIGAFGPEFRYPADGRTADVTTITFAGAYSLNAPDTWFPAYSWTGQEWARIGPPEVEVEVPELYPSGGMTGLSIAVTIDATARAFGTLVIPAVDYPSILMCQAIYSIVTAVTTDTTTRFAIDLRLDGVVFGEFSRTSADVVSSMNASGWQIIPAGRAATLSATVRRIAGDGTRTNTVDARQWGVSAVRIPTNT